MKGNTWKGAISISKRKSIYRGAALLALSGIIVKIIGLVYKIPLTNLIGDEGMGYFSSAYTIFGFFYILSTAGIPVAISLIVSEERAIGSFERAEYVYKTAMKLFLFAGAILSLAMAIFSRKLSVLIGNKNAYLSIVFISPSLFFDCGAGVLRGYFQGCADMAPSAVSQVIEALGKLIFGLGFSLYAINTGCGNTVTAAYALSGLSLGSFLSFVFLVSRKRRYKDKDRDDYIISRNIRKDGFLITSKRILSFSLPVTLSGAVMSLSGMIDLSLVMRRLTDSGYSEKIANSLYGNYSSLAMPLFNMPSVLLLPIAYSASPVIREAFVSKDYEKASKEVGRAMKYTSLIAFPASFGMCALSKPILSMIFTNTQSVENAFPLLRMLSASIFFLSFLSLTNSVLQAAGRSGLPIISMSAGSLAKIVSAYILIGKYGIIGAPVSTFICYFTASIINAVFVITTTKVYIRIKEAITVPLLSSLVCSITASSVYINTCGFFDQRLACLTAIASGGAVYLLCIIISGILKEEKTEFLKRIPIISKLNFKTKGKTNERKSA